MTTLLQYIATYYKSNQSAFGRACGVPHSRIQHWLKGNYVVVDGSLYSKRRTLPPIPEKKEDHIPHRLQQFKDY